MNPALSKVEVTVLLYVCAPLLYRPQIMRDPDSGNSKGFAFVKFASFDAADAAIDAMNGQHLCNRPISVSYAFKKDAKGERHGSAAGGWVGGSGVSLDVWYLLEELHRTPVCNNLC